MKRKIIAISLLFIWIFHCTFLCLFYQVARWQCHAENFVKYKENKANVEISYFTFTKNEKINWEEEGKELLIDGELYDVLELLDKDSLLTIKCFADKKEDNIRLAFNKSLKEDSQGHKKNKSIKKVSDFKYLKCGLETLSFSISSYKKPAFYKRIFNTKYIKINSPPPEC